MSNTLIYHQITGKKLERIVGLIESAAGEESTEDLAMACLSIAVIAQIPDVTKQQLMDGVKGASEWIAMFASGMNEEVIKN